MWKTQKGAGAMVYDLNLSIHSRVSAAREKYDADCGSARPLRGWNMAHVSAQSILDAIMFN